MNATAAIAGMIAEDRAVSNHTTAVQSDSASAAPLGRRTVLADDAVPYHAVGGAEDSSSIRGTSVRNLEAIHNGIRMTEEEAPIAIVAVNYRDAGPVHAAKSSPVGQFNLGQEQIRAVSDQNKFTI